MAGSFTHQRYTVINFVSGLTVLDNKTGKLVATAYGQEHAELIVRALNDQDSTELVELRAKLRVLAHELVSRPYSSGVGAVSAARLAEQIREALDGQPS